MGDNPPHPKTTWGISVTQIKADNSAGVSFNCKVQADTVIDAFDEAKKDYINTLEQQGLMVKPKVVVDPNVPAA